MSKYKLGDRVLIRPYPGKDKSRNISSECWAACVGRVGEIKEFRTDTDGTIAHRVDFPHTFWWLEERHMMGVDEKPTPLTADQKAIAKAEANLAALKERAAKKAKQAAERKAKAERAKALRGLSAAGKRVVSMLKAGSADDFGCQRESVIKLVAAITGDKPDAIKRAVAH